jgi:putative flippase GtrA
LIVALAQLVRQDIGRILRFGVVGSAGFIADAAILLLLINWFGANPIAARLVSAPIAILLTFTLNRAWSFSDLTQPSLFRSFVSYLSVQGVGFLLNLLVYSLAVSIAAKPAAALAFASAVAMVLNYLGSRYWAFARVGSD